jgi:CRP/FNR family transcriptional regulator, cyclic AMP receptor protein
VTDISSLSIDDQLAEHPFLRQLEGRYLHLLAAYAEPATFASGSYLLQERRPANVFYLIQEGKVALEVNGAERGQIVIETIGAGECLGWSWLFPPYTWHFSARAMETVVAIALDGRELRAKCEADHSLGYEIMKRIAGVLAQRLQATRLGLLDVYGDRKRGGP